MNDRNYYSGVVYALQEQLSFEMRSFRGMPRVRSQASSTRSSSVVGACRERSIWSLSQRRV
jgi:hypothetical protein